MSKCPICDAKDYTLEDGCPQCGHWDEDYHKLKRKREREREIRRHERRRRRVRWK